MSERDLRIEARPTKDLFISMLVKDIGLIRSIVDLVDNCVDGAKALRGDGKYDGLLVDIEANENLFRITDNCGGISAEVAREYAFRFGRPEGAPPVEHSVGQFGVGMKRALFKIGEWFVVESTSTDSRFVVEVDVQKWSEQKDWSFQFKELDESIVGVDPEEQGTSITIRRLHGYVAENFALENFQNKLREELEQAHIAPMDRGLSVTLNGRKLESESLELLTSEQIKPALMETSYRDGGSPVKVKVFTGIGDSDPDSAGWYVFCNERLVLGQDQSLVTGWGVKIPKYHNQYARFRGYAFFDSKEARNLPWNTTKTGVDSDSQIYQAVRLEMMKLARPVVQFLNRLDAEKDSVAQEGEPLKDAVEAAKLRKLFEIEETADEAADSFVAPQAPRPPRPDTASIQYRKPKAEIARAKELLRASSNKEVGERTFEYFLEMES